MEFCQSIRGCERGIADHCRDFLFLIFMKNPFCSQNGNTIDKYHADYGEVHAEKFGELRAQAETPLKTWPAMVSKADWTSAGD